jgi:hypothetical protein
MDNQDRRADLKRLVDTLRRVTTAVQVLPFVYSALSIVTLSVYNFIPEEAQSQLDTLFYISPVCIVAFLILSKLLRLCKWHKTACILPAIPQIVGFIDCYIITLTVSEAYIINAVIIVMTVLLLIAAYKVFFR